MRKIKKYLGGVLLSVAVVITAIIGVFIAVLAGPKVYAGLVIGFNKGFAKRMEEK